MKPFGTTFSVLSIHEVIHAFFDNIKRAGVDTLFHGYFYNYAGAPSSYAQFFSPEELYNYTRDAHVLLGRLKLMLQDKAKWTTAHGVNAWNNCKNIKNSLLNSHIYLTYPTGILDVWSKIGTAARNELNAAGYIIQRRITGGALPNERVIFGFANEFDNVTGYAPDMVFVHIIVDIRNANSPRTLLPVGRFGAAFDPQAAANAPLLLNTAATRVEKLRVASANIATTANQLIAGMPSGDLGGLPDFPLTLANVENLRTPVKTLHSGLRSQILVPPPPPP